MDNNGIFISYRRDDSAGYARALHQALRARLGEMQIFMDVDSIEPGDDFAIKIQDAVGRCRVFLAIIGKNWLAPTGAAGQRRLDDESDYVRIEISIALKRNVRVIPLLLDGVHMPTEELLPEPIKLLSRRSAVTLSHEEFESGVERLVGVLLPGQVGAELSQGAGNRGQTRKRKSAKVACLVTLGAILVTVPIIQVNLFRYAVHRIFIQLRFKDL